MKTVSKAQLQTYLARMPYARWLNIDAHLEGEQIICCLPPREENMGNTFIRALHGGVQAAFMQCTAQISIIQLALASDDLPTLLNLDINYLRSPNADKNTYARADLVKIGRRVTNMNIYTWQENPGKPVGTGTVNLLMPHE